MTFLQPYRRFEAAFIRQLDKQERFYLVSQSYSRAEYEVDHTKIPILFSPYKQLNEAGQHFRLLTEGHAAMVDIRTPKVAARMRDICSGKTDIAPYISLVGNIESVNRYIDQHYYEQMRTWIRKHRDWWLIREPNSLQPSFLTVMGVPTVKIQWGSHHVLVKLHELESV
jgi:hypothetical protein